MLRALAKNSWKDVERNKEMLKSKANTTRSATRGGYLRENYTKHGEVRRRRD